MAYWFYTGKTTSNYEDPEKGPLVLTPRQKFHAPPAAVRHLIEAGLVKQLREPKPVQTSAPAAPEKEVATPAATKSEPEEKAVEPLPEAAAPKPTAEEPPEAGPSSASGTADVVGSAVAEESAVEAEVEAEAEKSSKEMEPSLSSTSKGRKKRRRRGSSSSSGSDSHS